MRDSIARFVNELALAQTDALVNQYATEAPGLDRPGGAAIRCANLRAYLEPRIGAPLALIGEAPSAHGARFSGIAFTAERCLPPEQHTSSIELQPKGFTEHSATILRRAFEAIDLDPSRVILWNAVPFHPARLDDLLRNRRPSRAELDLGAIWLDLFRTLMQPGRMAAVGRSAQRILPDGTAYLRHPANGGASAFQVGLSALVAGAGDGQLGKG